MEFTPCFFLLYLEDYQKYCLTKHRFIENLHRNCSLVKNFCIYYIEVLCNFFRQL
jgi:hypothetical protein